MLKWAEWESFEFLVFSFEFKKKSETKDYSPTTKDFFQTGLQENIFHHEGREGTRSFFRQAEK